MFRTEFFGLVAGALLALGPVSTNAATLSLVGGTADVIDGDFNPGNSGGAAKGDALTVFTGGAAGGLKVSGKAKVTYTFIGFEAGAVNSFVTGAGALKNQGTDGSIFGDAISTVVSAGFLPFSFVTTGLAIANQSITNGVGSAYGLFGLAFSAISADGKSVLAFFDDGRPVDSDFDDMVVRIDISDLTEQRMPVPAPVPVPAAGVMMLTALGGIAALRRRRRA